ncbi:hypothetical protein [Streptomyces scabiei]|uniref:hypothetical protein n=1 Tax=Streptomyces scabiei TaxID=1930 RepID=UPI003F75C7B4
MGATYELFWQSFARDSIDGNGLPLDATVHYDRDYNNGASERRWGWGWGRVRRGRSSGVPRPRKAGRWSEGRPAGPPPPGRPARPVSGPVPPTPVPSPRGRTGPLCRSRAARAGAGPRGPGPGGTRPPPGPAGPPSPGGVRCGGRGP